MFLWFAVRTLSCTAFKAPPRGGFEARSWRSPEAQAPTAPGVYSCMSLELHTLTLSDVIAHSYTRVDENSSAQPQLQPFAAPAHTATAGQHEGHTVPRCTCSGAGSSLRGRWVTLIAVASTRLGCRRGMQTLFAFRLRSLIDPPMRRTGIHMSLWLLGAAKHWPRADGAHDAAAHPPQILPAIHASLR